MTTQTQLNTGSEHGAIIQETIRELRELFSGAPEPGKEALENVLRELTSQLSASGLRTDSMDYSQRRQGRPIASVWGPPRGTLVPGALRHGAARFADDRVCAGLEMTTFGAGIATQSQYGAASLVPIRSRPVFTKPEVMPIVFVADDDAAVRESLDLLIRSEGWHPELFVSAQKFLARPRATVPCCLILDVNLPGLNGLELQRQLADRHDMPIVFISNRADVPLSVQAMKAGGVEFLTKPLQHDVLLRVICDAIGRSREALRLDLEMRALRGCYDSLTPREREVMALVVSGLLNKQVGGELGIREITVKIHRSQVMRKMKAESLPDLVIMAARLGLRPARKQ